MLIVFSIVNSSHNLKHKVKHFFPGAYGPLTMDGNIGVDGILASCYAGYDQTLANFAMKRLGCSLK